MSRSPIRRIVVALVLVAFLVPALPSQAEAASTGVTASVLDAWAQFWNWVLGKNPDLPSQAQGRRNGPPPNIPPDNDKGSGIDPNGGGGTGTGSD